MAAGEVVDVGGKNVLGHRSMVCLLQKHAQILSLIPLHCFHLV